MKKVRKVYYLYNAEMQHGERFLNYPTDDEIKAYIEQKKIPFARIGEAYILEDEVSEKEAL